MPMSMGIRHSFRLAAYVAGVAIGLAALPAHAASRQATVRTAIRGALTLSNSTPLDFGKIIRGTAAGTVTINPQTGARTSAGGVIPIGTGFSRAAFSASGTANTLVRITVASGTIPVRRVSGTQTMAINTLRLSADGSAPRTVNHNRTLPATGTVNFAIAGRLNVAANQVAGVYAGTFAVTVNYQ